MVGASLACALRQTSARVAVIEAVSPRQKEQPSYDERGLALSLASQRIFTALGIWPLIAENANPIRHIHVSDQGHFGFVRFHASDMGLDALGHLVIAQELGQALMSGLDEADNIDLFCPARVKEVRQDQEAVSVILDGEEKKLTGRLLVVADGTHSSIRELLGIGVRIRDYEQTAIVANVNPERHHQDTAYERFTAKGPLALLPMKNQRCKLVYTVATEDAEQIMGKSDEAMLALVQKDFGRRLGSLSKIGERKPYPLLLLEVEQQVKHRLVLLGSSAHSIHPNGAQGFNLCLRDVAALAEIIGGAIQIGDDPGDYVLLEEYLAKRLPDQQQVIRYSNGLVDLFYNQDPAKVLGRNLGMLLLDMAPILKRGLMNRYMGIHGRQPAMVRLA